MNALNQDIPIERRFCSYLENNGVCNIMLREQNLVGHEIPIDCNGWCMLAVGEKEFQRMARDISGRVVV